jgi:hypothetical protein
VLDADAPWLVAMTETVPAADRSLAGSAALTWVELAKVVVRAVPLTLITAEGTKPVDVTIAAGFAEIAAAIAVYVCLT